MTSRKVTRDASSSTRMVEQDESQEMSVLASSKLENSHLSVTMERLENGNEIGSIKIVESNALESPYRGVVAASSALSEKSSLSLSSSPSPTSPFHQLQSYFSVESAIHSLRKLDGKKVISSCMFSLLFLLVWDSLVTAPQNRILQPDFSQHFLVWVQNHPAQGLLWILIFMAMAVIFMIPIGTPITVGCGYIYKGAYGWKLGVLLATLVSMAGSALGAIACFLLGRYLMRDQVRLWIRKYPLFDAIDIASAEHGLRIMAMLYLTPILPLGPVAYMCGTTSMALHHFVLAKVAALPLMMLYVFIGASTGTLMQHTGGVGETNDVPMSREQVQQIEENRTLIVGCIILSLLSITFISHYIKKELDKILGQPKRPKHGDDDTIKEIPVPRIVSGREDNVEEAAVELGKTASAPRQRKHG